MTKEERKIHIRARDAKRKRSARFVASLWNPLFDPDRFPTLDELPEVDVSDILQTYRSTMQSNQTEEQ